VAEDAWHAARNNPLTPEEIEAKTTHGFAAPSPPSIPDPRIERVYGELSKHYNAHSDAHFSVELRGGREFHILTANQIFIFSVEEADAFSLGILVGQLIAIDKLEHNIGSERFPKKGRQ
jgi:hypothetical protein